MNGPGGEGPIRLGRRGAVLGLAAVLVAAVSACRPDDGTGVRRSRLPEEGPLRPVPADESAVTGRVGR